MMTKNNYRHAKNHIYSFITENMERDYDNWKEFARGANYALEIMDVWLD